MKIINISGIKISSVPFFLILCIQKMFLFQNKKNEQVYQSLSTLNFAIVFFHLFAISQAIFEFHLEKIIRFLRQS